MHVGVLHGVLLVPTILLYPLPDLHSTISLRSLVEIVTVSVGMARNMYLSNEIYGRFKKKI